MIRLGIIGTGVIAHTMAKTAESVEGVYVSAVGSRSIDKAAAFSDEFGGEITPFGSYEELCRSDNVDLVYIATPHGRHYEDAILALTHDKHVFCEKAFTVNAAEARELVSLARSKKLFICEAMWPRFNPAVKQVRRWIEEGELGCVKFAEAEAGFHGNYDTKSRLFNEAAGGGSLLDMGVYPLSFVSLVFGGTEPDLLTAVSAKYPNGVDKFVSATLDYHGAYGIITTSISDSLPTRAAVYGENGFIEVTGSFINTNCVKLHRYGKEDSVFTCDTGVTGREFELSAVVDAINNGRLECSDMPAGETVTIMNTIDKIKNKIGLQYKKESLYHSYNV